MTNHFSLVLKWVSFGSMEQVQPWSSAKCQLWPGCRASPEAQSATTSASFLFMAGNPGTGMCQPSSQVIPSLLTESLPVAQGHSKVGSGFWVSVYVEEILMHKLPKACAPSLHSQGRVS